MKKLLWMASLCGMILLRSAFAGPEAHLVLVYWDASSPSARPARSDLVDVGVLQRSVIEDVDHDFYERTGSGYYFDGYLVGLAVRFDRPETHRTIFRVSCTDYDEAMRYCSTFPDHHIFSQPAFKQ
jgi:hypothetical protein